ncbi:hypothetical protein MAFF212519_29710 [Clavibacter michiganensis]
MPGPPGGTGPRVGGRHEALQRRAEQRAAEPREDRADQEAGQAGGQSEPQVAGHAHDAARRDQCARAEAVGEHAAEEEQALLAEGAGAEHQADREGAEPEVVAHHDGQERHDRVEAEVEHELAGEEDGGGRRGGARAAGPDGWDAVMR